MGTRTCLWCRHYSRPTRAAPGEPGARAVRSGVRSGRKLPDAVPARTHSARDGQTGGSLADQTTPGTGPTPSDTRLDSSPPARGAGSRSLTIVDPICGDIARRDRPRKERWQAKRTRIHRPQPRWGCVEAACPPMHRRLPCNQAEPMPSPRKPHHPDDRAERRRQALRLSQPEHLSIVLTITWQMFSLLTNVESVVGLEYSPGCRLHGLPNLVQLSCPA
jgi:hypothetical protein